MYPSRNSLISEICIVSLIVVSLLRTSRRPFFSVVSVTSTVKRTPISSYLPQTDNILLVLISVVQFSTVAHKQFNYLVNDLTLCVNFPKTMAMCPSIQAM